MKSGNEKEFIDDGCKGGDEAEEVISQLTPHSYDKQYHRFEWLKVIDNDCYIEEVPKINEACIKKIFVLYTNFIEINNRFNILEKAQLTPENSEKMEIAIQDTRRSISEIGHIFDDLSLNILQFREVLKQQNPFPQMLMALIEDENSEFDIRARQGIPKDIKNPSCYIFSAIIYYAKNLTSKQIKFISDNEKFIQYFISFCVFKKSLDNCIEAMIKISISENKHPCKKRKKYQEESSKLDEYKNENDDNDNDGFNSHDSAKGNLKIARIEASVPMSSNNKETTSNGNKDNQAKDNSYNSSYKNYYTETFANLYPMLGLNQEIFFDYNMLEKNYKFSDLF
jgi:hypothetical protein